MSWQLSANIAVHISNLQNLLNVHLNNTVTQTTDDFNKGKFYLLYFYFTLREKLFFRFDCFVWKIMSQTKQKVL